MTVVATCGHEVDEVDDLIDAALQGYTREDQRCIDYVTLCRECYTMYKTDGIVLFGAGEENKWLGVEK